jgi:nucleotide-binding universal stress UspA family protein
MSRDGVIVVGVDGSEESREALRWAARQAKLSGASLDVVAAWAFPETWGWSIAALNDLDPEADTRRMLEATVKEVLGSDDGAHLIAVEGRPAPVLLQAAEDAELLVVGSRGRGAFAGMVLGSVSEHCLHHASCPVVVVHRRGDG